ncbi:hypothetical protein LguiA_023103 [Lonicera macranthoides]
METTSIPLERENPSPKTSNGTNSQIQTPSLTPKTIPRSEPNPYPTTFIQADTNSFKQVVQMLTGSPSSNKPILDPPNSGKGSIPPIKTGQKKQGGFKLYERRNSIKNGLMINPSVPKRLPEMLSPSILDFPALVLSPVTPLNEDPFNKGNSSPSLEEARAIREKRFYLHPPTPTGGSAPELLPLFPVTSPRVSGSSS